MQPELLELFARAQTLPGQAAEGAGSPQRRRRSSRGTVAGGEEEAAAAAAAAAEVAAEQQAPWGEEGALASPPLSGAYTAGGGSDYGPLSVGGVYDEELIEPADTQQEQQAAFPGEMEEEAAAPGTAAERRAKLHLHPVLGSGEALGELGSIGPDDSSAARSGGSSAAAQQTAFTKNTALVLEHLRRELAPSAGSKRRHPSHGDLAAGMAALSLDSLLDAGTAGGGRRGRLDAARWFYESLVLRNTGFVALSQAQPYGDIEIRPTAQLLQP
ncbi:hypothetical protein CHLNCDRAFT_134907 [Chlorella variabilis]|uniref:Rad21/Rec8-like protein C-terminal eukaryotic domain-containing protein n=1 Tax=Chlorella variabilis TaxID=554065 RepID=E1ZH32_CHLVA|nr:hypothetical protein CHLNCDRAFT_134907 [Chlorella variabilis]EFN55048.1 hypothetical protein CHLNCDRAFT_134907 [Chlorella variabilis]|eukprot:XP_005847150.1 hypothetical protein CHLNCDRAFT_134907 [Chlorella variabilis]